MAGTELATALADALHFGDAREKVAIVCAVLRALADDDELPGHFAAQFARDPDTIQPWQLAAAINCLDRLRIR